MQTSAVISRVARDMLVAAAADLDLLLEPARELPDGSFMVRIELDVAIALSLLAPTPASPYGAPDLSAAVLAVCADRK